MKWILLLMNRSESAEAHNFRLAEMAYIEIEIRRIENYDTSFFKCSGFLTKITLL